MFVNRDSLVRVLYNVFKEYNEKQRRKTKNVKIIKSSFKKIYTQIWT